jgi:hypothetical protein
MSDSGEAGAAQHKVKVQLLYDNGAKFISQPACDLVPEIAALVGNLLVLPGPGTPGRTAFARFLPPLWRRATLR